MVEGHEPLPPSESTAVASHYARQELKSAILAALTQAGKNPERLKPEDLAPIDEFPIRGRKATLELALPYTAGSFDVLWTQHVAMNIADKAGLYRGMRRVLKPDGVLALYDVLAGPNWSGDMINN